tara:strand:- start:982 stop:1596 length:615 start_codon:yes stop_codon:yes gene_type:complete
MDKIVTILVYLFLLLSTMMISIAFNHVIMNNLVHQSDLEVWKDVNPKWEEKYGRCKGAGFKNTTFEGFEELDPEEIEKNRYLLKPNDSCTGVKFTYDAIIYSKNITNGSIAVYVFGFIVSLVAFIYHTNTFHIYSAFMNLVISCIGFGLWTQCYDNSPSENRVKQTLNPKEIRFIGDSITGVWIVCIFTLIPFFYLYVKEDESF